MPPATLHNLSILESYGQGGSGGCKVTMVLNDHVLLLLCKCDNLACWQGVSLGGSRDSYITSVYRNLMDKMHQGQGSQYG